MQIFDVVDFQAAERQKHRQIARTICFIGIGILALYVITAPSVGSAASSSIIYSSALMMVTLAAFAVVINSNAYLKYWWLDAPFMTLIFCAQLNVNRSFFGLAESWGTTPFSLVLYNATVFLTALVVGISGSFASFSLAAVSIVLICAIYVAQFAPSPIAYGVQLAPLLTALSLGGWANYSILQKSKTAWIATAALEAQKAQTERLLYNVLPEEVAERLRKGDTVADAFSEVSVIFIDLVGFSQLSRTLAPRHLVEVLNSFFLLADRCADRLGVEKVKTIGDAYLAVAGATTASANCAKDAIQFAVEVLDEMRNEPPLVGTDLKLRIGIHTGSVVGGVIGSSRMAYDYWGDTVNLASRIQAAADPSSILVSESTYYRAQSDFDFGSPRLETLKGIGETKVYPLLSG